MSGNVSRVSSFFTDDGCIFKKKGIFSKINVNPIKHKKGERAVV